MATQGDISTADLVILGGVGVVCVGVVGMAILASKAASAAQAIYNAPASMYPPIPAPPVEPTNVPLSATGSQDQEPPFTSGF
jgi:hypothetical protein